MRNGSVIMVIIPALNEEGAISGVIARIPDWVDRILVVNNGSTDRTAEVAHAAGAKVIHEHRRGYGRACLAGIAMAESDPNVPPDVIVFLDADGSDSPEQMEVLVDPIVFGYADMVIGSRTRGTLEAGAMTFPQRIGNMLAPALIRWIWGASYTDLGPFRSIRTVSLRSLEMDDETYGWTVQMQIRAARRGIRGIEVPVDYGPRRAGKSKISGTLTGVVNAATKILATVGHEAIRPKKRNTHAREMVGVFAKFPKPGKAKTRLIPALGAKGAADLHDQMVRHTLDRVGEVLTNRGTLAKVWTALDDHQVFASHFQTKFPCEPQVDGDLGQKMNSAFTRMLGQVDAAVIIGTDCPDISPGLLRSALDALRRVDVVLGPADDGGYYLIGLTRPTPSLFESMEWSTSSVLEQTMQRAKSLGLSVQLLPMLSDVDQPEDILEWKRVQGMLFPSDDTPDISVIVPTLNEESHIGQLVQGVLGTRVEVIVADGGSEDNTRARAAELGARVIIASPGRGTQLDAGVKLARGRLLLFLHADTIIPDDFAQIVRRTLDDPAVALGAFRFKLDRKGVLFRGVEWAVHLRCLLFRTPYGDQALFMRRDVYHKAGGIAAIPLMEDLDLVRRVRRLGRVVVMEEPAVTSSRRWCNAGVVRMTVINQACVIGFAIGIPPARLATWRNRLSGRHQKRNKHLDIIDIIEPIETQKTSQSVPEGS